MCGIAGIVAYSDISEKLIGAIRNLEYRGYDSCGVALLNGSGVVEVRKNVGFVDQVKDKERLFELSGNAGIAHTRWATHGSVTKENSHPHSSCDGAFVIVHNGIISNHSSLRKRLIEMGHTFTSETDTEVIAHLIEENYKKSKNVETAFISSLKELDGAYAIAMISQYEKDRIYCARNESPLIIGLDDGVNYIGSDFNAFIEHTKNVVIMDDDEYAVVTGDSYSLKTLSKMEVISRDPQEIPWDPEMAQKGGFPHYMLKEIFEQPSVVKTALDLDRDKIKSLARKLVEHNRVYFTGVGTTYYVAQFGQYLFSRYAGFTPNIVSSDEFKFASSVDDSTIVLATSQSGETYDTLTALRDAKKKGCETAAIVNVMGSTMARLVDHLILQGSGPEISVISTKAAISQMVILARLAIEAGLINGTVTEEKFKKYSERLQSLPDLIEKIINEKSGAISSIAREQSHIRHWLFLGRGRYFPIACESALKMKEVSYIHAEGMPSGFLKHGTIALIDDSLNSVIFMPTKEEEELYKLSLSSAEEIKARDGYTLGITIGEKKGDHSPFSETISLPSAPAICAPFLELVAAQLFSYHTATTLKLPIDRPRALAKSVTVA